MMLSIMMSELTHGGNEAEVLAPPPDLAPGPLEHQELPAIRANHQLMVTVTSHIPETEAMLTRIMYIISN